MGGLSVRPWVVLSTLMSPHSVQNVQANGGGVGLWVLEVYWCELAGN